MNYKFTLLDRESGQNLRTWVLQPPVTVGRGMLTNIHLEDGSISRRHCEFVIGPQDQLMVRDLGSKNGIFVEGSQVDKAVVDSGTVVQIGLAKLRVEAAADEDKSVDAAAQAGAKEQHADETHAVKIIPPLADDRYDIG